MDSALEQNQGIVSESHQPPKHYLPTSERFKFAVFYPEARVGPHRMRRDCAVLISRDSYHGGAEEGLPPLTRQRIRYLQQKTFDGVAFYSEVSRDGGGEGGGGGRLSNVRLHLDGKREGSKMTPEAFLGAWDFLWPKTRLPMSPSELFWTAMSLPETYSLPINARRNHVKDFKHRESCALFKQKEGSSSQAEDQQQ